MNSGRRHIKRHFRFRRPAMVAAVCLGLLLLWADRSWAWDPSTKVEHCRFQLAGKYKPAAKYYQKRLHAWRRSLSDLKRLWVQDDLRKAVEGALNEKIFRGNWLLQSIVTDAIRRGVVGAFPKAWGRQTQDDSVYTEIRDLMTTHQRTIHKTMAPREADRADRHAAQIVSLIENERVFHQPHGADHRVPPTVLDVGCGDGHTTGALASVLSKHVDQVLGIDIVEAKLPPGAKPLTYRPDGLFPLPNNSVDVVTAMMMLHHERNQRALIQEKYRVTKPGGLVLVREHDATMPKVLLFNTVMDRLLMAITHTPPEYTPPSSMLGIHDMQRLFKNEGFVLEDRQFVMSGLKAVAYSLFRKPLDAAPAKIILLPTADRPIHLPQEPPRPPHPAAPAALPISATGP